MTAAKHGTSGEQCCYACGKRGPVIPDRGRRYCERCLFADMDREAAQFIADTPVTVRSR